MTTWQQEAVGIEPWPGANVVGEDGEPMICVSVPTDVEDGEFEVVRVTDTGWSELVGVYLSDCVVDLSDPDTLAAFDRRLALRLGAPEEAVREGVRFYWEPGGQEWNVEAGYYRWWWTAGAWAPGRAGETGDAALLARVRAWKSANSASAGGQP